MQVDVDVDVDVNMQVDATLPYSILYYYTVQIYEKTICTCIALDSTFREISTRISETQQYVIVEEKSSQKLYELLLQPAKFFQ